MCMLAPRTITVDSLVDIMQLFPCCRATVTQPHMKFSIAGQIAETGYVGSWLRAAKAPAQP